MADLDNDGFDDVLIGMPGENVNDAADAGAVAVAFGACRPGSSTSCHSGYEVGPGASTRRALLYQSNSDPKQDLVDGSNTGDLLGIAVHGADLNRDGYADAILGVAGETYIDPFVQQYIALGALPPQAAAYAISYQNGVTHVVGGASSGVDATLETLLRSRRADAMEATVIRLPKRSTSAVPGLLDLVDQHVARALGALPSSASLGTPRFAVADTIVPYKYGYFTEWGTSNKSYANKVRGYVQISGPVGVKVDVYALVNAYCNPDGDISVVAKWDVRGHDTWSNLLLSLLDEQPSSYDGSLVEVIKLDKLVPGLPLNCKRVNILPSMELEVAF